MNQVVDREFREDDYFMARGTTSCADTSQMEDWITPSERRVELAEANIKLAEANKEMAEARGCDASGPLPVYDRGSWEGKMVVELERNKSSVALIEPAQSKLFEKSDLQAPEVALIKGDGGRPSASRGSSSSSDPGLLYEDRIAKAATLDLIVDENPLPKIQGPVWYNRLRYHYLSMYVRLHIIVLLANIGTLIPMAIGSQRSTPTFTYKNASTAFAANIFVVFLTRNEHFINALFHTFRWFNPIPLHYV